MHHLYTLLVMASIIASAPTYASGSCLSYGHSCWGAHGKRSDLEPAQFIVPNANSMSDKQARLTEYLLSLSQLQQQKNPEDTAEDFEREGVILMEQPLRLYQILDQPPKSSINN